MSEQPSPPAPDMHPDELAGWERLAIESADWPDHPGVNTFKENHLKRVLAERGLHHLINNYLAVNEDGSPELSSPDLQLVTTEPVPQSPEALDNRREIIVSFERAVEFMDEIAGGEFNVNKNSTLKVIGDEFTEMLKVAGVDPNDTWSLEYWGTYHQFLSEKKDIIREQGYSERDLDCMNLLATTPLALRAQDTLNSMRAETKNFRFRDLSDHDKEVFLASKRMVSGYNGQIRDFAESNPDVHVSDIKDSLETTLDLFASYEKHAAIKQSLNAILVGAQHEVAFGQVLQELKDRYGYDFRPATADEDTGQGDARYKGKFFDYVVTTPDGQELLIDVKASKLAVQNLGVRGLVGRRYDGTYVMASGLQTVLANTGKFFIESEEARKMADTYEQTGQIRDIDDTIARNN